MILLWPPFCPAYFFLFQKTSKQCARKNTADSFPNAFLLVSYGIFSETWKSKVSKVLDAGRKERSVSSLCFLFALCSIFGLPTFEPAFVPLSLIEIGSAEMSRWWWLSACHKSFLLIKPLWRDRNDGGWFFSAHWQLRATNPSFGTKVLCYIKCVYSQHRMSRIYCMQYWDSAGLRHFARSSS